MISNREIPNHSDLKPYNHAVAGHDGTLCDPDGELFIKPCVQQEIDFYQTATESHRTFADIMPEYLGTLELNDVTDVNSINEQLPVVADHISQHMKEEAVRQAHERAAEIKAEATQPHDNIRWNPNKNRRIATNKSVVLENAAYGFKHPNILDAKLGKRLWADDAPMEKRKRFDIITRQTTNGSHGFRIAGMRVYKGSENEAEWDQEGYVVYNKDYGRLEVNAENIVQEMRKFIFNEKAGIDEDLGQAIAGAFLNDLRHVERVLANEESRMFSASLLFTFEGNGEALRAAIEKQAQTPSTPTLTGANKAERSEKTTNGDPILSTIRVDSGIVMDDDGEIVLPNGGAIEGDLKVLEFAGSDIDEEEDFSQLPKIYSLKLIDFAHASWVPGQGPDENSLFGVRSLIDIFEILAGEK